MWHRVLPRRRGIGGCRAGLLRTQGGVAAVEFAIFAMVFLLILAGTIDLGTEIYTISELDGAVSAGAQYAENNAALVGTNPSGLATNVAAVIDGAVGSGWATSTVDVNNSNDKTGCYCPTGSPPSWSWGSTQTCGGTCSGGGVAGQFVTITASRTVSPLFPAFGFVQNGSISRSAVAETQ